MIRFLNIFVLIVMIIMIDWVLLFEFRRFLNIVVVLFYKGIYFIIVLLYEIWKVILYRWWIIDKYLEKNGWVFLVYGVMKKLIIILYVV